MTAKNLSQRPKSVQICSVPECDSSHDMRRGYCQKHYRRFQRYGDPSIVKYRRAEGSTLAERFWFFVNKDSIFNGCWKWEGGLTHYGYGELAFNGERWRTHILSWTLANGRRPTLHILHSCDHPWCVNPDHLREGTPADNARDKIERGRDNSPRKLSDADRTEIWRLLDAGVSLYRIAKNFGVAHGSIQYIRDLRKDVP